MTALKFESTPAHKKCPVFYVARKSLTEKTIFKNGGNGKEKSRNRSLVHNENSGNTTQNFTDLGTVTGYYFKPYPLPIHNKKP